MGAVGIVLTAGGAVATMYVLTMAHEHAKDKLAKGKLKHRDIKPPNETPENSALEIY